MADTNKHSDSFQHDKLQEALLSHDHDAIREYLTPLHPAEIAHILESSPVEERVFIWELVNQEYEGEILTHVNDAVRLSLMNEMEAHELVAATEGLDTDDLADLLPEMPDEVFQQVLSSMDDHRRNRLEAVLTYSEDSAGGLMNVDTITVREDITINVVERYLRRLGEMPETTDTLIVINRDGYYLGLLSLATILTSPDELLVAEVMDHEVEAISADKTAQDVAILFEQRDLISAPVVDQTGKLLGRITIDDVVDVIRDQADHDFMGMAGLNEEEDIFAPVMSSSRRRAIWLGVNLLTALIASLVIRQFDATIEKLVALAVLMPIVASMGGIAGSQTLTLVIRAMALGQVSRSNSQKLLRKELAVGLINGLFWAMVMGIITWLWFDSESLGLVIAAALVINLIFAAFSGAFIPLLLKRVGADPALAGSVVLTTITDVIGFFAFLGLAATFLV
jgi:magnesium transporter